MNEIIFERHYSEWCKAHHLGYQKYSADSMKTNFQLESYYAPQKFVELDLEYSRDTETYFVINEEGLENYYESLN